MRPQCALGSSALLKQIGMALLVIAVASAVLGWRAVRWLANRVCERCRCAARS